MADTNNIFLYNIPKFENSKVYPVNQCDLCCDISVVEPCPLSNCEYKMCGLCWNKIINEENKCPVCRRNFPSPPIKCSDRLETMCIKFCMKNKICFVLLLLLLLLLIYIFAIIVSFNN